MKRFVNVIPSIKGYYIPDVDIKSLLNYRFTDRIQNKGYRNLAYILYGFINNSNVTLITTDGSSYTFSPNIVYTVSLSGINVSHLPTSPLGLNFGTSNNPHDITRYELYSRFTDRPVLGNKYIDFLTDKSVLTSFFRYAITTTQTFSEVGLYVFVRGYYEYRILLSRGIINITREAYTEYFDGYQIEFPLNFTKNFIKALDILFGYIHGGASVYGVALKDINGSNFVMRQLGQPASGIDIWIGSDNTPPSSDHYHVLSPISSLTNNAVNVVLDTTLQECRIEFTGTYTPTTDVDVGEIACYMSVNDTGGTARKIMIARGVWDTLIHLNAGTTYAFSIVIKLG